MTYEAADHLPLHRSKIDREELFDAAWRELTTQYNLGVKSEKRRLITLLEQYIFTKRGIEGKIEKKDFSENEKSRIIGIAFPFFNGWLYSDFARVISPSGSSKSMPVIDKDIVGTYRYFRYRPPRGRLAVDSDLATGIFEIFRDEGRPPYLGYAHTSDNADATDPAPPRWEHRGFTFLRSEGAILIGFKRQMVKTVHIRNITAIRAKGFGTGIDMTAFDADEFEPFAAPMLICPENDKYGLFQNTLADQTEKDKVRGALQKLLPEIVSPDTGLIWPNAQVSVKFLFSR